MKVLIKDIHIKREINPRFGLDSDYIDELKNSNQWPPLIVNQEMILIDGFHRLEAAKRRGDKEVDVEIKDISQAEALALAAKLNTTHGKRLTVLELAKRIKLLVEENGWSQGKAASYFNKDRTWINQYISIANNLNTTLVTRVTPLDYRSARELAKLPQNKQEKAYQIAQKMALQDRRTLPSSRLIAKAVKKIQDTPPANAPHDDSGSDQPMPWLKLTTLWSFSSCDPQFGFPFPGRIPGQIILNLLHYYTKPNDLIVDPFGGSGTTLDVCRYLARRCLIYDLKPARPEITKHDISLGFPKETYGCDLIFLDPPYWRQKRSKYPKEEGSFSETTLDEFNLKMKKLIQDCHLTLKPNGYVVLMIQNTTELEKEISLFGKYFTWTMSLMAIIFSSKQVLPQSKELMYP